MRVKERIPDEATLAALVDESIDVYTSDVRERVGALEHAYRKHRLRLKIGYIGSVVLFVLLFSVTELGLFSNIAGTTILIGVVSALVFFAVALWWWAAGVVVIRHFHTGVNAVLYDKAFAVLGVTGRWISQSIPQNVWLNLQKLSTHSERGRVVQFLERSELITSMYNRLQIDDAWDIAIENSNLFMCELDVKHESGSGKNRRVITLFHGLFASFELDTLLEGKTFITTDKDASGFGNTFFWSKGAASVKKTELEWNDFEALLRVSTNNEIEARTILTTDYMNDLYDWWKEQKEPIRISFIKNRMYLLFPSRKIRFNDTIDKITDEEIKEYLLTIAKPLLHVVHLIEDVRL